MLFDKGLPLALLPPALPHVDWLNDGRWVGYEVFNQARVPPPHTWQDWVAAILLFGAVVVFFIAGARFIYWWRSDVMGIFGTGYRSPFSSGNWVDDMRANADAQLAQREAELRPPQPDLRGRRDRD